MAKLIPAATPDQVLAMSWRFVMTTLTEAIEAHEQAGQTDSSIRRSKLPPAVKIMSGDGIHQHRGWYSQLAGILKKRT